MSQKFFAQVYKKVQSVPVGKVTTYGAIAKSLNTPDARRVGHALHANKSPDIPCHRVVTKEGKVSDSFAFGDYKEQKRRLEAEGVTFKHEKIVDLQKHGFMVT